jgi:hypothetical protein
MSDQPNHSNACPRCGATVEPSGFSYGIGSRREGDPLPEANQQLATCPKCSAKLRRVEDRWAVDEAGSG